MERALDKSLQDLDTPYVDVLLMHYPVTFKRGPERFPRGSDGRMLHGDTTFVDTWRAMEKSKGVIEIFETFCRGYTKAFFLIKTFSIPTPVITR